jgi:uncharacterized phage protein (TIGR01671 family)
MCEAKFRAWDKENNRMCEVNSFHFGTNEINVSYLNDNYDITTDAIMQLTELHDKNGKEIYVGDCFSIDSKKTGTRIGIATVVWHEMYSHYKLDDTLNNGEYDIHWFADNQPVIGNIYENKELLK